MILPALFIMMLCICPIPIVNVNVKSNTFVWNVFHVVYCHSVFGCCTVSLLQGLFTGIIFFTFNNESVTVFECGYHCLSRDERFLLWQVSLWSQRMKVARGQSRERSENCHSVPLLDKCTCYFLLLSAMYFTTHLKMCLFLLFFLLQYFAALLPGFCYFIKCLCRIHSSKFVWNVF